MEPTSNDYSVSDAGRLAHNNEAVVKVSFDDRSYTLTRSAWDSILAAHTGNSEHGGLHGLNLEQEVTNQAIVDPVFAQDAVDAPARSSDSTSPSSPERTAGSARAPNATGKAQD